MSFNILEIIISVLITALMITVLFRRFHLPVVLGYFLVGAVMGPNGLGFIPDEKSIKELAEFGIVFLMFTVGLEFSQPQLFALKFPVFVMGSLQVLLSIVITTLAVKMCGLAFLPALVTGGVVAMSSTAIVVKQLHEQYELRSAHGLNAIGILLFQDVAVIPFIILIVSLSKNTGYPLAYIFLWALLKGLLAITLLSAAGRWLLKPLFHVIAGTRAIELFTLTVLLITLTAAWLTNALGLSYALGAFLAGIMLAETEFRHQIEIEIRPFRDILLGLFFISIGMLSDVSNWQNTWHLILLLVCALSFGKMLLIMLITRLSGYNSIVAMRTGLILAQGSEFGFAILTLAFSHHMLPDEYSQILLAALLISIAISPIFIHFNRQIADFFLRKYNSSNGIELHTEIDTQKLSDHIIICGYGRVGQHIGRILQLAEFPFVGMDIDAELVKNVSLAGENVLYGDASHPEILNIASLETAKALVISFYDCPAATRIISLIRPQYPKLPILVRCKDYLELAELKNQGATKAIVEIFEESLTLSQHLLQLMDISAKKISMIINSVRDEDYSLLHKIFGGRFNVDTGVASPLHEQLKPIILPEKSFCVNKKISDINFRRINIEIVAIRRGKHKALIHPKQGATFKAHDIVIVCGSAKNIDEAERILLKG